MIDSSAKYLYSKYVRALAQELEIEIIEMTGNAVKELQEHIILRYGYQTYYAYPLHDNLLEDCSLNQENGWLLLKDFIQYDPVCLFFEFEDIENYFIFPKGFPDLERFLWESYCFVFYLTNPELEYLACFEKYNNLIGSGTLIEHMRNLEVVKTDQVPFHYQKLEKQPPPLTLEELKVMYPDAFRHFKD